MTDAYGFLPDGAFEPIFEALDECFGKWRHVEIAGPGGVGKSHLCSSYARRSGCAIANRALSRRLMRPSMSVPERLGRVLLPKHKRSQIRIRAEKRAAELSLGPRDRAYLEQLVALFRSPLDKELDESRRASFLYCIDEAPAAVMRRAHLEKEDKRALLDEGVLKLLLGFLFRYPGKAPESVIEAVRACLDDYPGDRCALFLDAPAHVVAARRTYRGDRPKPEPPHEASVELLADLCRQTGWFVLRFDAWKGR